MSPQRLPVRRRGFSFVELLFAIAVLGIGFIMIAAVFPVGLQQTKITLDETAGAAGSRSMSARLQQTGQTSVDFQAAGPNNTKAVFPDTFAYKTVTNVTLTDIGKQYSGQVRTLNDPRDFTDTVTAPQAKRRRYNMWQALANDLINPSDPRSATAVLFKRDAIATAVGTGINSFAAAPTAQVISINALVGNQSVYVPNDVSNGTPPTPLRPTMDLFNLEPRPVAVQIVFDPINQNYVASFFSVRQLDGAVTRGGYPGGTSDNGNKWDDIFDAAVGAVGEGAFVVISDDRITTPAARGKLNGHTFRLGNRRTELGTDTYDLAPGYDFTPDAGADGVLASAAKDDLVAVGADKDANPILGVPNPPTGYKVERPRGTGTADGTTITVDGSAGKKGAVAFVFGRGFSTSSATPVAASAYAGPVQDVSLYTTFVSVPNP